MELLKDQFKGERLFIICDGVSILTEDRLADLAQEYTWAVPQVFAWKDRPFNPTFGSLGEFTSSIITHWRQVVEDRAMYCLYKAEDKELEKSLPFVPNPLWMRFSWGEPRQFVKYGYLLGLNGEEKMDHIGHAPGNSIMASALQPALWLGFREFYFLGMDQSRDRILTEKNPEGKERPQDYNEDPHRMILRTVKRRLDDANIPVFNLSPITNDDVLPKASLADVLG